MGGREGGGEKQNWLQDRGEKGMMKPMLTSQDKILVNVAGLDCSKLKMQFYVFLLVLPVGLCNAQAARSIRSVLPSQPKCWCLLMSQVKEESRLGK